MQPRTKFAATSHSLVQTAHLRVSVLDFCYELSFSRLLALYFCVLPPDCEVGSPLGAV